MQRKLPSVAALSALAMCWGNAAFAQSSVTLYGVMSVGVGYVSNEGGHSSTKLISGTNQNSRWGLRGVEDLGGGSKAVFALESGFGIDDGKSQQGGRLFGRQAFVGLSNDSYGTVSFGRQYDSMYDYIDYMIAPVAAVGLGGHIGDNDNTFGSFRHNNSVKYVTPTWNGFQAEASYALSEAASTSNNRSFSLGGLYDQGPWRIALTYLQLDNPGLASGNASGAVTDDYFGAPFVLFHTSPLSNTVGVSKQRVAGLGAGYQFEKLRINGVVTTSRYDYKDGVSLRLDNYDANLSYKLSPALVFGAAYVYTNGQYSGGFNASPKWHMGQLSLDYFFSKRTDVYIYGMYQKASSAVADIYSFVPSSNGHQTAVVAGIRHKF
ncbi:porin (plasmid) [Cupriavidus necator]|uniref:Porin n=1 Tax=Cupriavidus necator TaxID=106590 RepID=A0A367PAI1_CUPNE|nr:porin [Cupriavidus necator]QQX89546.1 porin [Cupriavidus necator]RCJ04095.1 porin [Cupriavidus necator]